jgi:nicotinamide-nucleotide adenylyltransferase
MPAKTVGLFIGRFQPFHKGHLLAAQYVATKVDTFIIAIGSSQYYHTAYQPFSVTERRQMIQQTLHQAGVTNYTIFEVSDIHDDEQWVEHVMKLVPHFDVVFTNNELVRDLFTEKNIKVEPTKFLKGVSGTLVRQKLESADSKWKVLVPPQSAEIIQSDNYYAL